MGEKKSKNEIKFEIKLILAVVAGLLMMMVMSGYIDHLREPVSAVVTAESEENDYEGIIRLHVVANSDTEEDQNLKLYVRDEVLMKLQKALAAELATAMESRGSEGIQREAVVRGYIENNLDRIQIWAEQALKDREADYPVDLKLGITWIPEREYDGIYFPAGNYEALKIVIGEGQGENWWCVIFPPLCLIGEEVANPEEGNTGSDSEGGSERELIFGEGIILRSKIMELLSRGNAEQE